MPDFRELIKDLYTTKGRELTEEKLSYIETNYGEGKQEEFIKDFYATIGEDLPQEKFDYIKQTYLSDFKKKEIGGLPLRKTAATAPQYFGERYVPTSGAQSKSKLPSIQKIEKGAPVPVKPLSGDMPEAAYQNIQAEKEADINKEFKRQKYDNQRYYRLKDKQQAQQRGYDNVKSYYKDRETFIIQDNLNEAEQNEIRSYQKFIDAKRSGNDEVANKELNAYLNERSKFRAGVVSQINELKDEKEAVKKSAAYQDFSPEQQQSVQASLDKRIANLNLALQPFYDPKAQLTQFVKDNKAEIASVSKPTQNAKDALEEYVNSQYTKVLEMKESLGFVDGLSPLEEFGAEWKLRQQGRGDEVDKYYDESAKLKTATKLLYLNRTPIDESETALGVGAKSFIKSLAPKSAVDIQTNQAIANNVKEVVQDANIGSAVAKEQMQFAEEEAKPYAPYSANWFAEPIGGSAAFMLEFVPASIVTEGLFGLTKLGRVVNALENIKKGGKTLETGVKYFDILQKTKVGRGLLNAGAGGLKFGVTSQTVSEMFPSQEDEVNFTTGVFGGSSGVIASKLFGAGGNLAAKMMKNLFGNKAVPASRLISSMGDKIKRVADANKEVVVGEFFEEAGESLGQMYRESDSGQEFMAKVKEQFGDLDNATQFTVQTLIMAIGMGKGTALGKAFFEQGKDLYNALPRQSRAKVDEVMNEVKKEQDEVNDQVAEEIKQEEGLTDEQIKESAPVVMTQEKLDERLDEVDKRKKEELAQYEGSLKETPAGSVVGGEAESTAKALEGVDEFAIKEIINKFVKKYIYGKQGSENTDIGRSDSNGSKGQTERGRQGDAGKETPIGSLVYGTPLTRKEFDRSYENHDPRKLSPSDKIIGFHAGTSNVNSFEGYTPDDPTQQFGYILGESPNNASSFALREGQGNKPRFVYETEIINGDFLSHSNPPTKEQLRKIGIVNGVDFANWNGDGSVFDAIAKTFYGDWDAVDWRNREEFDRRYNGGKISAAKLLKEKGFTGNKYESEGGLGAQYEVYDSSDIKIKNKYQLYNTDSELLADQYHKAKADGSNPELVKAVEQSLKETQAGSVVGKEAVKPTTKAERKAIASAKIDEMANALKDLLPKIEGEKLGVGQDEIIDVIAKAVKALVNAGIEINEAIKQVKARLSEAFDGVEDIDDERIKVIVEGSKPPKGKKTRAIGEKYTKKGYKLPDNIKYYQSMVVEEVEKWAKDFYDKYGYEGAIDYIEDFPMDAQPETRVILGTEVMKRTSDLLDKATDPKEIDELKTRYYRVLNQIAPAATTAARTMVFMKTFYSSNPFVHVEEVQQALDAINQTKITNAQKAINELLKINGVVANQVANNIVNNVNVKSKVEKAKRNYENSKSEAKKLWQALSNVGVAENPWERARKNVKFDKALAKLAKDFVVYQSVKFEAFLKEVASTFGIAESDIDKTHLKSIFEDVKSKEIQKGIKGSLKDIDVKLKELIEQHYTDVEAAKENLADKLSKEFGLAENDAKEVAELVKKEFNKLTYAEKLKQLKNSGLKKGGWWDTIIDLSNAGALSEDVVREQFAKELGIEQLTPEIEGKLLELSKAIRNAPENTQERARRIIDLEDYKKKVATKFGFKDYLIGTFLTNIFGSFGANEINMAHNILRTKMYMIAETVGLISKGDFKQLSLMFNALANGYRNGFRNFKEVFTTGKLSYKDVGEIKARNIWELMQIVPEKDLPLYENAMRAIGYAWLTHNRFWSRTLQSFDALSGIANYEIASLFTAIDKADELGLKGDIKEKWVREQISRDAKSIAKAKAKAKQDGLKEGTKAFRERVEDYVKEQRPKWLNERAKNIGQRLTLTQAPDSSTLTGYVANVFNKVIHDKPFIKFIMPVTNTISNLFITSYEHTPLEAGNWLFQVIKNKRKEDIPFNKAFSNAMKDPDMRRRLFATATGTAAGVALFALAGGFDDKENCFEIFGSGSGDIELDNYKKSTGWKPYSVRFNCDGDYYSYQWMPLFAMLVGMVGDLRDYTKYGKDGLKDIQDKVAKNMFNQSYDVLNDEQKSKVYAEIISGKYNYDEIQGKQWGYVFANIATTPAKLFLNYGFMTTLKDMFEIASGKEQTAKKAVSLAARTGVASVPIVGAGWVREVKQSIDPNVYKTTSFKDEILKNVPFVEMPNKVKIDGYGRNVTFYDETSQTGFGYFLKRRFKSDARGTDLDAFWSSNGVKITPPDNTEFYNDEDYKYYVAKSGELLYNLHDEMFKRGDFENRTPEELKDIVRKTATGVRNVVNGAIRNAKTEAERKEQIESGMKSLEIGREIAAERFQKRALKEVKLTDTQRQIKTDLEKNKSMEEKIQYITSLRRNAGNGWSSVRRDLVKVLGNDVIDRIKDLEKEGVISPKLGIKKPETF